jgi:hypothetical protein
MSPKCNAQLLREKVCFSRLTAISFRHVVSPGTPLNMLAFRFRRHQLCDPIKRDSAGESSLFSSTLIAFRAELCLYPGAD